MSPYSQIVGYDQIVNAAEPNRGGLGAFNAAFGNSAEAFLGNRKPDPKTGKIEANWKDRLFGHSTEELTEEYYKKKLDGLLADDAVTKYLADTKNYGGKINIKDRKGTILSKIGQHNEAQDLRSNYLKQGIVVGPQFRTTDEVAAEGQKIYEANRLKPGGDLENQNYTRAIAEQSRNDALQLAAQSRADAQAQQANAMTLALMQNQSANKRADNQMQLQMMQQDYNNRRLDMQEARNLRQDRHKAILQIMAGLKDMNRAFQY